MNLKKMIFVKGILVMLVTAMLFACDPQTKPETPETPGTPETPETPAETVPVEDVDVKPKQPNVLTALPLSIGESKTFTATVTPENATNKKVVWSFVTPEGEPTDSDICELKDNGDSTCTVTGKKKGFISLKVESAADSTKFRIVRIEVKFVPESSGRTTLRVR